ncbi:MAG: hypothetical protein ICV74_08380 [Thermoleophilia bacterium]|nr:hypothetical protein [Thermoleophilia bacterium]
MVVRTETLTPGLLSSAAAAVGRGSMRKRTLAVLAVGLLALPLLAFAAAGLVPVGALVVAFVLGAFLVAAFLYFASVLTLLGAFHASADATRSSPY